MNMLEQKERVRIMFNSLTETDVSLINQSENDYVVMGEWYGDMKVSVEEYCPTREIYITEIGGYFLHKDEFFSLFANSGSTNELLIENFN